MPVALSMAADNEVWGIARFTDHALRAEVEAGGIQTIPMDIGAGDYTALPNDVDYLLHFAAYIEPGRDYDLALRVNAEATGLLMNHCRNASACLVVSSCAVYRPHPDHAYLFAEDDPLGDSAPFFAETYAIAKIAQEAVARTAARQLQLPTTIARMNAAYSEHGGMPVAHMDAIMAGKPIVLPESGHAVFNPIHQDDVNAQIPALLAAATVPATVLNWCGNEPVEIEEWCRYLAEQMGKDVSFMRRGQRLSSAGSNNTKRRKLIGECTVHWRDGMRRVLAARYPERGVCHE